VKRKMRRMLSVLVVVAAMGLGVLVNAAPARADTRTDIVSQATGQLGGTGCSPGYFSSCGINWCAEFARWAWSTGGVTNLAHLSSYAESFQTYGILNGTFHARSGYTPQPGDAVVFDWDHLPLGPGTNQDPHPIDHVAIVTSSSGGRVYTIGGNQGSQNVTLSIVSPANYSLSDNDIVGYSSPVLAGVTPPPNLPTSAQGYADVNGDGRSDVIAENGYSTWVMLSTGSSFAAPADWYEGTFQGSVANLVADINGDGKADLIAENGSSTWVMLSTGSSFAGPTLWSGTTFQGSVANLVADINGDGKADLIAENGSSTWVMLSTGSSFGTPTLWSGTTFQGAVANLAGDINGDGKADLIAENGSSTWVMLSTGSSFGAPTLWSATTFQGAEANQADDINGDGLTDLVAENGYSTWVMLSTGSSFAAPTDWSETTFLGVKANLIGDITGDGKADLVAENGYSTWAMVSSGTSFGPPADWYEGAFAGAVADLG